MSRAYREQAIAQFEASPIHLLTAHGAPMALGIYALYLTKTASPVYFGLATGVKLARRLSEHAKKIESRQNIDVKTVWCRYLVMGEEGEEWVAASAESALIAHYTPKWNKSGFSGHVPGKGRLGVRKVPWDEWYPPK